jgi:hypothetical protein
MSLCSHSHESSIGHWGSRLAFVSLVYNTWLIRINPGYQAAQIRLIFRLHLEDPTHILHGVLLVYVQWFSKFQDSPSKPINMFNVHRLLTGGDRGSPIGDVIHLDAVAQFIQLIPEFGKKKCTNWESTNSMDAPYSYFVNSFADKEIFQAVY